MFTTGRAAIDTPKWAGWLAAAQMVMGATPKAIEAALMARIAAVKADEAVAQMQADTAKVKLSKTITSLAVKADKAGLVLSIVVKDGKASLAIGKARKARSTDGKVSTTSRKSAFVAAKEGKKKGDTFTIVKAEKGYKCGERFIPRGKLAGYILKVHPTSHAAEILKRYGYSL